MTLHVAVLIYCTLVALFGGATCRLTALAVAAIAAAVVLGLVGLDFVFFGSADPWLTLTKGSGLGLAVYFVPRLLVLSVLTVIPAALGRSLGVLVSRLKPARL